MYPEFIAIFVGLGILITMMAAALVLLVLLLKGKKRDMPSHLPIQQGQPTQFKPPAVTESIVFCRNCATQFSASQRCCPKCGTPR